MAITPYAELDAEQRAFIDSLLDSYIASVGKPPGCSDAEFKHHAIALIEQGRFVFVQHERPGRPPEYSLEARERPVR